MTLSPGSWPADVTSATAQLWRCSPRCLPVTAAGVRTYTVLAADAGAMFRGSETGVSAGGSTVAYAPNWIGPVRSASVASGVAASARTASLRTASGLELATARLAAPSASAARSVPRAVATRIVLRRGHRATGALRAWACRTPALSTDAQPCTTRLALGARRALRITLAAGQRAQIVVARGPGR
jgi:hypothetical protein